MDLDPFIGVKIVVSFCSSGDLSFILYQHQSDSTASVSQAAGSFSYWMVYNAMQNQCPLSDSIMHSAN
jgi:hypothetical protein